eukprot:1134535-Pelagomonas_calceolata.AAC.1
MKNGVVLARNVFHASMQAMRLKALMWEGEVESRSDRPAPHEQYHWWPLKQVEHRVWTLLQAHALRGRKECFCANGSPCKSNEGVSSILRTKHCIGLDQWRNSSVSVRRWAGKAAAWIMKKASWWPVGAPKKIKSKNSAGQRRIQCNQKGSS